MMYSTHFNDTPRIFELSKSSAFTWRIRSTPSTRNPSLMSLNSATITLVCSVGTVEFMPRNIRRSISGNVAPLNVVIPTNAGIFEGIGRHPVQRSISRVLLTLIANKSLPSRKTTTSHLRLAAATVFFSSMTQKFFLPLNEHLDYSKTGYNNFIAQ